MRHPVLSTSNIFNILMMISRYSWCYNTTWCLAQQILHQRELWCLLWMSVSCLKQLLEHWKMIKYCHFVFVFCKIKLQLLEIDGFFAQRLLPSPLTFQLFTMLNFSCIKRTLKIHQLAPRIFFYSWEYLPNSTHLWIGFNFPSSLHHTDEDSISERTVLLQYLGSVGIIM